MDDFALFHDDVQQLEQWRARIHRFLEGRRLRLHRRKTWIAATTEPAEFLGFVLMPDGYRRLPEDNVRRFRNRLRGLRMRWSQGTISRDEVDRKVNGWIAHAAHADSWRLRQAIFRGGWYDPTREGLAVPQSSGVARGLLEQQTEEPAFSESQQEQSREPQQQQRLSGCPHARRSEPPASRGRQGVPNERPGTAMMRTRGRPSCPAMRGGGASAYWGANNMDSANDSHAAACPGRIMSDIVQRARSVLFVLLAISAPLSADTRSVSVRNSLLLLIDTSGSMDSEIGNGNPEIKIEAAKDAAIAAVDRALASGATEVAVMAFRGGMCQPDFPVSGLHHGRQRT